ncbi:sigma-54 interaction domain-containing protein [Neobacillus mesonae]|uniref:sigma-54 interaction domain-containing protein n=1 Tax=Neobacillus mesonae TaxID=1193713 RepID=UPI002E22C420|nr:sigma 54-interacting transcriptional regulator [Neobacillus mesonae]MED4206675.1 sigma 54-interacting transcriptional regulator [Neobacillus mesonae]
MLIKQIDHYKQAYEELQTILEVSFDGITIADGEGMITRSSKSMEELFGVKQSEIVGKNAAKLEETGILDVSVTREVLKNKKQITIVQKTSANRIVLVTGIPIFDVHNNIEKIINISKDITETKKLVADFENLQTQLEWYKQELNKRSTNDDNLMSYKSPAMRKVMDQVFHIGGLDATVLLLGETGVGKSFMANMIHQNSKRKDMPFITINCGAIPENLLESELFGYEKGSFTGASKEGKKGLFEAAGDGTIFLDEIGDMPLTLQVKLLTVLDERKVRRIGGAVSQEVKARIIAATNKDLKQLVQAKKFREDLYYRLNVVPITIPSLRERKEDLHFLINMFLRKANQKYGTKKFFSDEALRLLAEYEYPGNIRELQNLVERLVITTIIETIDSTKIHEVMDPKVTDTSVHTQREMIPLKEAVEQVERNLLTRAIREYKSTRKVAEVLGIDQSTVVKKVKKLKITL